MAIVFLRDWALFSPSTFEEFAMKELLMIVLCVTIQAGYLPAQDTFSIVAVDSVTGEVGVPGRLAWICFHSLGTRITFWGI